MTVEEDPLFFECGFCQTRVQAAVKGRHGFTPDDGGLYEEWFLVACTKCKQPNLVGREYYGSHGGGEEWGDWRIFPPRARVFGGEVPRPIRRSYDEAQVNLRSGSFLSAAMMCRRVVELLAKAHGIKTGDLAKKLLALKDQGVIDGRLYEWATALRFAGNDAAHEDDPDYDISKPDADDLLTFTEAIIDYVYIYRARFDEFTKRRPPRKTSPKNNGATKKAYSKKAPRKP